MSKERALTVIEPMEVTSTPAERAAEQFEEYQALQKTLDARMPKEIMLIGGNPFRKKKYWRAVAKGFRLTTTVIKEERVEYEGDWGYLFVIRATHPNGESAEGDGSCMASEKQERQRTVHNVRAHAFTRAKNRAISDLVGFGEVSAEETQHDDSREGIGGDLPRRTGGGVPSRIPQPQADPLAPILATDKQRKLIWARAKKKGEELGIHHNDIAGRLKQVLEDMGFEHSKDVTLIAVDFILEAINGWTLQTFGEPEPPAGLEKPF